MWTRPSSASFEITLTRSRRRSSLSAGTGTRTTTPSSVGFNPSSDCWSAREIALINDLSQG